MRLKGVSAARSNRVNPASRHVVQAVKEADEVVVAAGELVRARGPERCVAAHPFGGGDLRRPLDRGVVVIESVKGRLGVGVGHEDGRGAVSATKVGDSRAGPELLLDGVERGDPLGHEVGSVAGTEELLGAREELGIVLVPAEALAGPDALGDPAAVLVDRADDVIAAEHVHGAVLVGDCDRLLGRQDERLIVAVVLEVPARRLR